MCGTNDVGYSTGIYDAELQAILRALIDTPVTCHMTIHTDNKSAVTSITHPPATPRGLLRRSGRQWLALIEKKIKEREKEKSKTNIVYVPAHTDQDTKECVGNRCADILAKRAATIHIPCTDIQIEQGDPFVCIWDEGRVMTADPRSTALKRLIRMMKEQWTNSNTQSAYSHDAIGSHELWQWATRHGTLFTGFVMKAITNVLHWKNRGYTHDCPYPHGRSTDKKKPASIAHIIECKTFEQQRREITKEMIAVVARYSPNTEYNRRYPREWKRRMERDQKWDFTHLIRHWGITRQERKHKGPDVWLEAAAFGAFQQRRVHAAMIGSDASKEQIQFMINDIRMLLVRGMHAMWRRACDTDPVVH